MHALLIDDISAKGNKNVVIECQDRQKECGRRRSEMSREVPIPERKMGKLGVEVGQEPRWCPAV